MSGVFKYISKVCIRLVFLLFLVRNSTYVFKTRDFADREVARRVTVDKAQKRPGCLYSDSLELE